MNGSECKMHPEPQGGKRRRERADERHSRNLQSVRKSERVAQSSWKCLVNATTDKHILWWIGYGDTTAFI